MLAAAGSARKAESKVYAGAMAQKARLRDANAYEASLLDPINLRLLKELQEDGRLTVAELGRRISMSAPRWPSVCSDWSVRA